MGLPGSGKTTFAQEYCEENDRKYYRNRKNILNICIDEERNKTQKRKLSVEDIIEDMFDDNYSEVIIDGLFLTNSDIAKLMKIVSAFNVKSVEIHYWNPDVEKCLHNDIGRRKQNAAITIENCNLEFPDIEKIKSDVSIQNISVVKHDVVEKPYWKAKAEEYKVCIEDGRYLYSDSWSLGGSWCNCWGDSGSVSGEPVPSSFTELDMLLEKICPTITFLQYKNIFSQCVETKTYTEGDYYGGSVEYAKYKCDLEKLFDLLKDKM